MFRFKSVALASLFVAQSVMAEMPKWSYDPGPNPDTKMGRELIDITAAIPNMPAISKKIMGRSQKFRPAFGPIPWRMLQDENKVKMLFIGQDGTHIAEAAGRPATAGFGGRAQDLAKFFGVNEGAAFINTYSFTIKGQYGIYNTPYIFTKNGESSVRTANLVSNQLWAMSMSQNSPITKWRNSLIDWIIRNNKESMKLVVTFGGAARDAIAEYAISKGATVGTRYENQMKNIQVPVTKSEYAGGNNTFPSLVARDGGDLYADIVGRKLVYKNTKDQKAALESLKSNLGEYLEKAVFTKGGPYNNGLLNAAQLGGYDIAKMVVNNMKTRSLKGLKLDDGTVIENDILIVELPHPSYLSRVVMDADSYSEGKAAASRAVMNKVKSLNKYAARGWKIKADPGMTNYYALGKDYEYGRSDIGPEFYDFGTPKNRMVSRSTARRMSGAANVVIIGTRDNGKFSRSLIKKMTDAKAAFGISNDELYIARPKTFASRYTFDPGPGEEMAKLMVTNLDQDKIFETKEGKTFSANGIDAYYVRTHPDVGAFGHYRGTFDAPSVLVVADPIGYDDLVTARALTGERGQYLQGLMDDLGVEDNYLVFKTVPFGMDNASESDWNRTLSVTADYRRRVLRAILKRGTPDVIIADGEYAQREVKKYLGDKNIPIVNVARTQSNSSDMKVAGKALSSAGFELDAKGRIANIPRTHLSFYARTWEGTSGDRVITSDGIKYEGIAFAEVVPSWAYNQDLELTKSSEQGVEALVEELDENGFPLPYESIPSFLRRTGVDPDFALKELFVLFENAA
jgi:hypothetical protein